MNKFIKAISFIFIVSTLIMLAGRNHLILGTFLIISRYLLILIFVILIYQSIKKEFFKIKKYLVITIGLLFIESAYVKFNTANFNLNTKSANKQKLSIISYNIYFKNKNRRSSLNLIKSKKADIVFLQEVTPKWNNSLNANLNYPHKITKALNGTHGISVYAKHPIKLIQYINNDYGLPIAQIIELNIKGKNILLCNTHLASPAKAVENPEYFLTYYFENYKQRKKQYNKIESYINSIENKYAEILFIGDLNTTEYEPLFRDIMYDWQNTSKNFFSKSFPNSSKLDPVINLDYILFRKKAEIVQYEVLKGGSSDHSAIYSEIQF